MRSRSAVVERDNATPTPNVTSDTTHVFGHDGHGSVRILYDLAGTAATIAQAFTFSAYGQMIALHNATAQSIAVTNRLSSLGYSGEHFDAKAQQQYLRARFYDPANGRFNTFDRFDASVDAPRHLHKYAYAGGDPILGADPSGFDFTVGAQLGNVSISASVDANHNDGAIAAGVQAGKEIPRFVAHQTVRHAAQSGNAAGMTGGLLAVMLSPILGTVLVNFLQQEIQQQQQGGGTGVPPGGGGGGAGGKSCKCVHEDTYLPRDDKGRATGASAILGQASLAIDYGPFTTQPIWWNSLPNPTQNNWRRGHLLARSLGGQAILQNQVPLTRTANNSAYARMEFQLRRMASNNDCFLAVFIPVYTGDELYPDGVLVYTLGDKSGIREWLVHNSNVIGDLESF